MVRKTLETGEENKYDVIHSHGAKANMIASIIRRITGIQWSQPFTATIDWITWNNMLKQLSFGVINMVSIRKIDYHIGVSDSYRNMLISKI